MKYRCNLTHREPLPIQVTQVLICRITIKTVRYHRWVNEVASHDRKLSGEYDKTNKKGNYVDKMQEIGAPSP
jgi:hypothetical protein